MEEKDFLENLDDGELEALDSSMQAELRMRKRRVAWSGNQRESLAHIARENLGQGNYGVSFAINEDNHLVIVSRSPEGNELFYHCVVVSCCHGSDLPEREVVVKQPVGEGKDPDLKELVEERGELKLKLKRKSLASWSKIGHALRRIHEIDCLIGEGEEEVVKQPVKEASPALQKCPGCKGGTLIFSGGDVSCNRCRWVGIIE